MTKVNLTIVAKVNPNEKDALSYYVEQVSVLYKKVNAKSVYKSKVTKSLIGNYVPSLVSIMEFQNIDSLNEVFESDKYKSLIPFREKAFLKLEAYISE